MRPHRLERMASTVKAVVSDAILNRLNDPRICPLTSVTRVQISGDLQIAKVYVSVLGSESEVRRTLAGLQHAAGHIQRIVSRRLTTRFCPQVHIVLDNSLKLAAETIRIINETAAHEAPEGASPGIESGRTELRGSAIEPPDPQSQPDGASP